MSEAGSIQTFLNEAGLRLWWPTFPPSQGAVPVAMTGQSSLLALPRVPVLCAFPTEAVSEWSVVEPLFQHLLRACRITHFLPVYADAAVWKTWGRALCTRTAARVILSFGVEESVFGEGQRCISLPALADLLAQPIRKREVWNHVQSWDV